MQQIFAAIYIYINNIIKIYNFNISLNKTEYNYYECNAYT